MLISAQVKAFEHFVERILSNRVATQDHSSDASSTEDLVDTDEPTDKEPSMIVKPIEINDYPTPSERIVVLCDAVDALEIALDAATLLSKDNESPKTKTVYTWSKYTGQYIYRTKYSMK